MFDKTLIETSIYQKLVSACETGRFDILKSLCTEYNLMTYLTQRCNENGMNLLMMACFNNRLDVVQYLLTEHQVNIHDTDDYGNNALMYAMCNQNIDIVYYLLGSEELKEHANIYHVNQRGESMFTYACEDKNMGLIEYFLFEHNMIVDDITIQWLKQNEHSFILNMISTRDLYQKLDVDLFEKDKTWIKRKI